MPPKPKNKVPPKQKNVKPVPQKSTTTDTSSKVETASGLNQEVEDQFILELYWCIQELESSLASGKLQEKPARDIGKSLNTLRSNTAPLVKKRQIMRSMLGNYREKMTQDEQKLSKQATSVKFANTPALTKKFVFLKKACSNTKENTTKVDDNIQKQAQDSLDDCDKSMVEKDTTHEFRFNFQSVT
ncbi:hypothetical protein KPH14_004506 [Odynerus spinipes]|uniref:Uncharacterized protein n=1 Tax=Odynerus spinipes TaxID=1348599 RepID=A0AAD9RLW0_9HYME|nr:hypothetical protein KPH14_004506 [Odynerus spinipes]